jgi:two-component system, NtrC family, sensor kinase
VVVVIKDSGHGIPEEIRDKIFDPFFTTKRAGEGTGIGLDIVQRIIEKHSAGIELESEVGKGTSFKITLPVN